MRKHKFCNINFILSENYWIISDLKPSEQYTFYVRSLNSLGWSELSEASEEFDFAETKTLAAQHDYLSIILGIGISLFVIVVLVITACICSKSRRISVDYIDILTKF